MTSRSSVAIVFAVVMYTATVVHEEVHQRTHEDKQKGPPAVKVRPVLRHQIESADSQKPNQYKVGVRAEEAARFLIVIPVPSRPPQSLGTEYSEYKLSSGERTLLIQINRYRVRSASTRRERRRSKAVPLTAHTREFDISKAYSVSRMTSQCLEARTDERSGPYSGDYQ